MADKLADLIIDVRTQGLQQAKTELNAINPVLQKIDTETQKSSVSISRLKPVISSVGMTGKMSFSSITSSLAGIGGPAGIAVAAIGALGLAILKLRDHEHQMFVKAIDQAHNFRTAIDNIHQSMWRLEAEMLKFAGGSTKKIDIKLAGDIQRAGIDSEIAKREGEIKKLQRQMDESLTGPAVEDIKGVINLKREIEELEDLRAMTYERDKAAIDDLAKSEKKRIAAEKDAKFKAAIAVDSATQALHASAMALEAQNAQDEINAIWEAYRVREDAIYEEIKDEKMKQERIIALHRERAARIAAVQKREREAQEREDEAKKAKDDAEARHQQTLMEKIQISREGLASSLISQFAATLDPLDQIRFRMDELRKQFSDLGMDTALIDQLEKLQLGEDKATTIGFSGLADAWKNIQRAGGKDPVPKQSLERLVEIRDILKANTQGVATFAN